MAAYWLRGFKMISEQLKQYLNDTIKPLALQACIEMYEEDYKTILSYSVDQVLDDEHYIYLWNNFKDEIVHASLERSDDYTGVDAVAYLLRMAEGGTTPFDAKCALINNCFTYFTHWMAD